MMVGHSAWHDGISLLSHLDEAANGRDWDPSMNRATVRAVNAW